MEKETDIVECARKIKKYCEQSKCPECKFKNGVHCILSYIVPAGREIPEKQILDKEEKEYLKNIIKPFKNRVQCIVKYKRAPIARECIVIMINECYSITLPDFDLNVMYKGMEQNKGYTLKELGL